MIFRFTSDVVDKHEAGTVTSIMLIEVTVDEMICGKECSAVAAGTHLLFMGRPYQSFEKNAFTPEMIVISCLLTLLLIP